MFRQFARSHPGLTPILGAVALAAVYLGLRGLSSVAPPLPAVSGAAFLVALVLYAEPMMSALRLEGRLRPDPPIWRLRCGLVIGYSWFTGFAILAHLSFPSPYALWGLLIGAAIFGGVMSHLQSRQAEAGAVQDESGADSFDLTRPTWASRSGDWFLRLFPFVQWGGRSSSRWSRWAGRPLPSLS